MRGRSPALVNFERANDIGARDKHRTNETSQSGKYNGDNDGAMAKNVTKRKAVVVMVDGGAE